MHGDGTDGPAGPLPQHPTMHDPATIKPPWPLSALACFLVAVAVLSVPTTYVVVHARDVEAYHLLADRAIMWCPAVAALMTVTIFGIGTHRLGLQFPKARYALLGYLLPLLTFTLAYSSLALLGIIKLSFANFSNDANQNLHLGAWSGFVGFGLVATIALILDCAATIGEEIGWRGFLVPALTQRLSFFWTALVSGLIWAVWHYPMIFELGFGSVGSLTSSTVLFTIDTVLLAFIMTWLRLRSGSIWPTVIFHASNNTFSGKVFEGLPIVSGVTAERISKILVENCILIVVLALAARRGKTTTATSESANRVP